MGLALASTAAETVAAAGGKTEGFAFAVATGIEACPTTAGAFGDDDAPRPDADDAVKVARLADASATGPDESEIAEDKREEVAEDRPELLELSPETDKPEATPTCAIAHPVTSGDARALGMTHGKVTLLGGALELLPIGHEAAASATAGVPRGLTSHPGGAAPAQDP